MNTSTQSKLSRPLPTNRAGSIFMSLLLAAGLATSVLAQGEIANGTVSGTGTGPYTYDLTFGAAANSLSPVGSVWYAWTPGNFYLPGNPISGTVHTPSGWSASIFLNSIQFFATSSANDIPIGGTLSGFSYEATFSPTTLSTTANSGLSVAYAGGIESDGGYTFTVQTVAVPEPSTPALLVAGMAALFMASRRQPRAV